MVSISIRKMRVDFGDNTVIPDLTLDIQQGEFVTLLGPSGCGKTTTLRCIAGLEQPSGGTIAFGDKVIAGEGKFLAPEKRNLGMVFQSYALWPHMTVAKNVGYPLRMDGVKRRERAQRVAEALDQVGLASMGDRSIAQLSGGQQQRVALARATASDPAVLLFDEPLSNLDAALRGTMRAQIREVHERIGTTSVYVTHDQTEALTLSDRIVILESGEIRQIGTPEEVYDRPASAFVAGFLGYENLVPVTVQESNGRDLVVVTRSGGILKAEGTATAGEERTLAARALAMKLHHVSKSSESALPSNTIDGQVISAAYLGDQFDVRVQAGEDLIKVRLNASDPMRRDLIAGVHVGVEFPVSAVRVLKS